MLHKRALLATLALLALPVASCGDAETDAPPASNGAAGDDVGLRHDGRVRRPARGDLRPGRADGLDRPEVPAAVVVRRAKTGEYEGFDIDVATEIATRLGVDIAWQTPAWDSHHRGQLERPLGHERGLDDADQRAPRGARLHPAVLLHACRGRRERRQHDVTDLTTDLDGEDIGVCSACTYEQFLNEDLGDQGLHVRLRHRRRQGQRATTPTPRALQDLALGDGARLDAVITSLTTAQGFIDAGKPVKIVGDPVFYEPLGGRHRQERDRRPDVVRRGGRRRSSARCTTTAR